MKPDLNETKLAQLMQGLPENLKSEGAPENLGSVAQGSGAASSRGVAEPRDWTWKRTVFAALAIALAVVVGISAAIIISNRTKKPIEPILTENTGPSMSLSTPGTTVPATDTTAPSATPSSTPGTSEPDPDSQLLYIVDEAGNAVYPFASMRFVSTPEYEADGYPDYMQVGMHLEEVPLIGFGSNSSIVFNEITGVQNEGIYNFRILSDEPAIMYDDLRVHTEPGAVRDEILRVLGSESAGKPGVYYVCIIVTYRQNAAHYGYNYIFAVESGSIVRYDLIRYDSAYRMVLNADGQAGDNFDPDVSELEFGSVAQLIEAIREDKFEAWQLDVIRGSFKSDEKGVILFDLDAPKQARMPHGFSIDGVYWRGENYSISLKSAQDELAFIHWLTDEEFRSKFDGSYTAFFDKETVELISHEQNGGVDEYVFRTSAATLKKVRYRIDGNTCVDETYRLESSMPNVETSASIPYEITLYHQESGGNYIVDLFRPVDRYDADRMLEFGL